MGRARANRPSSAQSQCSSDTNPRSLDSLSAGASRRFLGPSWDFWAMRLALVAFTCLLCYTLTPFGLHGLPAAGLGFFMAMVTLLAELRLRRAEISGLMGGAVGAVVGLLAALPITPVCSPPAVAHT